MKDRRKKPSSIQKIRLLCRYNGVFEPRPPYGKLRYVGGDTRIVSVDRNIGILRLISKISELCPNNHSFTLRFQLHESEGGDGDAPLVLIASDDDVRCMIDEYDKLESNGKHARLWIFVCRDGGYVGSNLDSCFNEFCSELDISNLGVTRRVAGMRNSGNLVSVNALETNIPASCIDGIRNCEYSFRKMALEQQVSSTHAAGFRNSCGFVALTTSEPKNRSMNYARIQNYVNPFTESSCEVQVPANLTPGIRSFDVSNGSVKSDHKTRQTHCDSGQTYFTSENCNNQLVGRVSQLKSSVSSNRVWSNLQSRFRNHRIGAGDFRHQRVSSFCIRNQRNNLSEMGNNCSFGSDGKICSGKCYPGLRPSSNISKNGQAIRSHYTHLWKQWSGIHEHAREGGMVRMKESNKDTQTSFNLKTCKGILTGGAVKQIDGRRPFDDVGRQGDLAAKIGNSNPQMNHLGNLRLCHGVVYPSLLPCNVIENAKSSIKETTTTENLLRDSNLAKHGAPAQPMVKNFRGTCEGKPNHLVGGKPKYQKEQPNFNGALESLSHDLNTVNTLSGAVSSVVDLCLYNQSLPSSKEVGPPASSLDVLESLTRLETRPQSNPLDLMDEGQFTSGPVVENSNKVTSNSSSENENVAKREKELDCVEENQVTLSCLSMDEKVEVNGSHTYSKVNGGISSNLVAFYTHFGTRELQTIKNSDLEDIRELGSGTYGTVFYGKWKGSDVAIKRIKPSCFTGGELEEERLIADFWKEAHILGQLHHPNVVSFYGVVTDGPVKNLATVTEYMVNGSLKQVLQRKDRTIDRRKRIIIAMDAAFGMEYLHEKNIVHFDLKSHNLLVNMRDPQRPMCKIGDLGLSKVKQKTLVSGGIRGTIPWMAPELLTSTNMVTEKVDVYSFGIVMWELLTGEEPYSHMRSEETIAGIIKGDLRPEVPSWCDPAWRSLMERCWSSDPESRPPFSEISKELRAMAATMNIK